MKFKFLVFTAVITLFSSGLLLASQELDARKELNSIGIAYNSDSLFEAILKNDKLVINLFIKSGHSLEDEVPVKNNLATGIPQDAIVFFNRTFGAGVRTPAKYEKYEQQYTKARLFNSKYAGMKLTPLMFAIFNEKNEIASLFIDAGANVNKVVNFGNKYNKKSECPLSLAIQSLNTEIVHKLLKSGANPVLRDANISFSFYNVRDKARTNNEKNKVIEIAKALDKKYGKPSMVPTLKRMGWKIN